MNYKKVSEITSEKARQINESKRQELLNAVKSVLAGIDGEFKITQRMGAVNIRFYDDVDTREILNAIIRKLGDVKEYENGVIKSSKLFEADVTEQTIRLKPNYVVSREDFDNIQIGRGHNR